MNVKDNAGNKIAGDKHKRLTEGDTKKERELHRLFEHFARRSDRTTPTTDKQSVHKTLNLTPDLKW